MKIKDLADIAKKRVHEDKDLVLAFTGNEGDGKSGLSINFGLKVDGNFDLKRNILYSPTVQEAREKIFNLPHFSYVDVDEAIKVMYKLNWSNKLAKYLNVVYAICRNEHKITGLCMPRFTDFTEYFRNHRIRVWVHIFDPISKSKNWGEAAVMVKSWNPLTSDPWGMVQAEKLYRKLTKRQRAGTFSVEMQKDFYSKLDSFVDTLEFGFVKQDLWEEYIRLKAELSVADELDEDKESKAELWQSRCVLAIKALKGLGANEKDVARLLKVSKGSISKWLVPDNSLKRLSN